MKKLILSFLLLFSSLLIAQSSNFNGWEVSASFAPNLDRKVNVSGARIEVTENNIFIAQRPRRDTLSINGTERVFERLGNVLVETTENNLWYGANLRIHRRFGSGFDVSLGSYYSQAKYTTRAANDDDLTIVFDDDVATEAEVLYPINNFEEWQSGITTTGSYHLFAEKRLHPYFGMGLSFLVRYREQEQVGRRYTGDGTELPPANIISDQFLTSTVFNFDFYFTAGLLYRLSDNWFLGLDFSSRSPYGRGLTGLQVRHRFGRSNTAP